MPQIKDNASLVTKLKTDHYLPSPPETDANLAAFALALRDQKGAVLLYAKNGALNFSTLALTGAISLTGALTMTGDLVADNLSGSTLTLENGLVIGGTMVISGLPPATAASAGVTGTITWDTGFVYVCTNTNTWKRAAIATW